MEPVPSLPSLKVERFVRLLPWLLFAGALGLRLIGIGWGLPNEGRYHSYHPDEPLNWMVSQRIEPATGDFDPGFYNYGTLYFTLLRMASDVVAAYGGGPERDDPKEFWLYVGRCTLAGRILSAVAGAGTVVLLFLMSRRFAGPFPSALGALWIAVAPGHVVHSRFATVDVLAVCLLAASAYFALQLLPAVASAEIPSSDGRRAYRLALLSGALAGLSAGTKYTGVLGLLTLGACLAFALGRTSWKPFLLGVGAAVAGFLLTTPGALVHTDKFLADVGYELQHSATGHGLVFVGKGSAFGVQMGNLAIGGGLLMLLIGVSGLLFARGAAARAALALSAAAIPYFVLIGRSETMFLRYTFPLFVPLAFGFGLAMHRAGTQMRYGRALVGLGILALGGMDGAGLRASVKDTVWMSGGDPRDQAAQFLRQALAREPGAKVGIVSDPWFYTPPLFPECALPRPLFAARVLQVLEEAEAAGMVRYVPENPAERFDWDVRLLEVLAPRFVVFSSFEAEGPERLKGRHDLDPTVKVQVDRYRGFVGKLLSEYELVAAFGGGIPPVHDLMYIRPTLWVWRRKPGL